jgi:hypothetical protein
MLKERKMVCDVNGEAGVNGSCPTSLTAQEQKFLDELEKKFYAVRDLPDPLRPVGRPACTCSGSAVAGRATPSSRSSSGSRSPIAFPTRE